MKNSHLYDTLSTDKQPIQALTDRDGLTEDLSLAQKSYVEKNLRYMRLFSGKRGYAIICEVAIKDGDLIMREHTQIYRNKEDFRGEAVDRLVRIKPDGRLTSCGLNQGEVWDALKGLSSNTIESMWLREELRPPVDGGF